MQKYIITFIDKPGEEIAITYNSVGRLLKIDATDATNIHVKGFKELKESIPVELTDPLAQLTQLMNSFLNADTGKSKLNITQADFDVSFETFWNAYDNKRHKVDAQKLFEKLSYADKYKCIESCTHYHAYRKRKGWLEQMLPDSYIRKREFETDFKKLH